MANGRKEASKADLFPGLISNQQLRQEYVESGWLVSIPLSIVPAHWLFSGEQRLDGSFYSQEAVAAQRVVNDSGFESEALQRVVSDLYILGRFKRIYASDKKSGWPYLSASDALTFRPTSDEWIASEQAPRGADRHFVKEGWLLISSSGSVGRLAIATKRLEKFFLTHDLIRVIPSEKLPVGYLYAFLSTWVGQALIVKDQYGAAIKHLEPHQIANVSIPLLPRNEQEVIHDEIMRTYALREEANALLDQADVHLYHELGLLPFDESLIPYLTTSHQANETLIPHPKAFSTKASELQGRFDGSFHVPAAHASVELLKGGKFPIKRLSMVAGDIIVSPRFKRIYVPEEYGIPLLQGSHLPQARPQDLKYISRTQQKNLSNWVIQKGWVLLTCSGTIGRVGLVSSYRDQWAASQHLLRIIPDQSKGQPGYIAAFLMTPYAQHQILAKTYGGVVDEITSEDTGQIWIPDAPISVQEKIGQLVVEAFEKKDQAASIESTTIKHLEQRLVTSSNPV
jgi:type I restriction enzyme S subunit